MSKKGTIRRYIVRKGSTATSVSILRGVVLHLTWDRKLKLRDKALKFVGVSEDKAKDTAEHHDNYLADGLQCVAASL